MRKKALTLLFLFCCLAIRSFSTTWTTATSGNITTLANWTNGSSSPTTFATTGDKWVITKTMTLTATPAWTVGVSSGTPDTVVFASGGSINMSGAGSTFTMTIYGEVDMNGGSFALGGAGTTAIATINGNVITTTGVSYSTNGASSVMTVNVNGNYSMGGDTIKCGGASGAITMNVHGNVVMSAGYISTTGASCDMLLNVFGNYSVSGTAAMTTNAGSTAIVHLKLHRSVGTMLIDNTSTGTWAGANVYVDSNCIAQLDDNFKTPSGPTSGSGASGFTVNGTLICPAAYVVNGTGKFALGGVGTLKVAHTIGINGAITTTGTRTFSNSANYEFNGTAAQVTGSYMPAALVSPDTITVNNPAGVTLSQTTSTTGKLAFAAGVLSTGAFTMTTPGAAAAVYGAGPASYVSGTLIKTITGITSVNFEVGDTDYVPMSMTFSTAGTAGTIGVKPTLGLHPAIATSGILSTNIANHYWTVTTSGAAAGSVTGKATYNLVDILGGTNAGFKMQVYRSSAWLGSAITCTNTSSPYTSSPTTTTSISSLPGDYIFGNSSCGTAPISSTSATLCEGATLTLTDITPGGSWTSATPSVGTVSSAGVVSGISAGTVVISYTASGCTVNTVLTVNPLPSAGTVTAPDTFVCVGRTLVLSDAVTGGTWSVSNPAFGTISGGTLTGVSAGFDTVIYTVTNSCGSATAKKRIKVVSAAVCHAMVTSDEHAATELRVFPNPNDGSFKVNVVSENDDEVQIVIVDVLGKTIKQFNTTTNRLMNIQIDASPGIYLLSAYIGGSRYTARIVIE